MIAPKQLYVANRHPGLSAEEFRRNWRAHGELAIAQPLWENIFRYTQGDRVALPADVARRLPELDATSDGVSTIWFHSFDAALAIPAAPEHPILLRDEARIFREMVADVSMFTEEEVVVDDGSTTVKLVLFLERASDVEPAAFEAAWRAHAGGLSDLDRLWPRLVAYRINIDRPIPGPDGEPQESTSSLAAYDGFAEIGFRDVAALESFVRDVQFDELLASLRAFARPAMTMATSELLLFER